MPHPLRHWTPIYKVPSERPVILTLKCRAPGEEAITTYFSVLGLTRPARAGLELTTFRSQGGSSTTEPLRPVARNVHNIDNALIEQTNTSLSGGLVVCPRVIPLTKSKHTITLPVRVCNISATAVQIPPKSLLCSIHGVKVVDSWSPESQTSGKKPKKSVEDLNIKIAQDNLTSDQVSRAKDLLAQWTHLFSEGPSDIGETDLL